MRMSIEQGHDNKKIAERLNLSVFTVRNQKARGNRLLVERFRQLQEQGIQRMLPNL
jgi:transposase